MNNYILTILVSVLITICFIGAGITMSSATQGLFVGGLMICSFWLGRLLKSN